MEVLSPPVLPEPSLRVFCCNMDVTREFGVTLFIFLALIMKEFFKKIAEIAASG